MVAASLSCAPTAVRARQASASVAPVVHTSSTTTTGPRSGRATMAPRRFAHRAAVSSEAWSAIRRTWRSAGTTATGRPSRDNRRAAETASTCTESYPRSRTADRLDGTGTSVRGPSGRRCATASASRAPSTDVASRACRSLCAAMRRRSCPSYTRAALARGNPSRLRLTSNAAVVPRAVRQPVQIPHPGVPHPGHVAPSRRSAAVSRQFVTPRPCTPGRATRQVNRCLWTSSGPVDQPGYDGTVSFPATGFQRKLSW